MGIGLLPLFLSIFLACSSGGQGGGSEDAASSEKLCPVIIQTTTTTTTSNCSSSTSLPNCTEDGQVGCVTTNDFKAAKMSNFSAASVMSGTTIAGVTGTITNRGSWDLQTSFPGAGYYSGVSNMPGVGVIKSGVFLFGLTGDYPSATYTLTGATATADLDVATFDAKMKSSANFEWFGPDGTLYTNSGDSDLIEAYIADGVTIFGLTGIRPAPPDAWDLRAGVTVGNTVGKLRVNCRNAINDSLFNYDGTAATLPNNVITTGSVFDLWDTIDDYNGGSSSPYAMPPDYVSTWSYNHCDGVEAVSGDDNVWKLASSQCSNSSHDCRMADKITGLQWSEVVSNSSSWAQAVNVCEMLNHDSLSDWRLPTQKELLEAYNHGVRSASIAYGFWISPAAMNSGFWSSTSDSSDLSRGWTVNLSQGSAAAVIKGASSIKVVCVR
jgi:hypothetical protein